MFSSAPLRMAVIGAGPAGIYAAETLTKTEQVKSGELPVAIDLFDRLPAPFGLIRYGVAPDHPRIKGIMTALRRILGRGDIRFFGNVEFGTDLTLEELREHYDVVVFATGAIKDAALDIPGIDLDGSYGAADFVAWYDGNPDYPLTWPLKHEKVAVLGNGNVALDVARVLAKSADELLKTEIPANVYEGMKASPVTDVHVFGRRGPTQVKFTPLETRELAHPQGVQMVLDQRDFDQVSEAEWEAIAKDNRQKQVVDTFVGWLNEQNEREANGSEPTDHHGNPVQRRLHLHFWHRPVEVLGEDGVMTGMRFERTRLDEDGNLVGTGEMVDYELGAVYRAIGYFGSELAGVPFDADRGVVKNELGRVLDENGKHIEGVYANGWIKRGPVGLIGATKSDALETVTCMLEDLPTLTPAKDRDPESTLRLLESKGVQYTTWEGWLKLEEHEQALGAAALDAEGNPRERVKVVSREEMVRISNS
ncbi:FAD-dependent oxidoreductase [Dermabacteraceae bacterium P13101]